MPILWGRSYDDIFIIRQAEYLETSDPIPLCFVKCTVENGPCYCQTIVVTKGKDLDPKEDLIRVWNRRVRE